MSHVEGSPLRSKQGIFTQLSKSKQGIFIQLSKSKQGIFIQLNNTLFISQGEISQTARKIKTFETTTIRINERTNTQVNNSDLQHYSDLQPLHRFFFLFTTLPRPVNWAEACGLWCFSVSAPAHVHTVPCIPFFLSAEMCTGCLLLKGNIDQVH